MYHSNRYRPLGTNLLLLSPCRESLSFLIVGDNIYLYLLPGVPNDSGKINLTRNFGHLVTCTKHAKICPKSDKIKQIETNLPTARSMQLFLMTQAKDCHGAGQPWGSHDNTPPHPSASLAQPGWWLTPLGYSP